MTDPVSLSAGAIATLACQKFIDAGAGELAKKFTTDAIATMESLLKRIWNATAGQTSRRGSQSCDRANPENHPRTDQPNRGLSASGNG